MELTVKSFGELTVHELYEILRAREDIFTHEKGMKCHDIDENDYNCLHAILKENDKLIAYLRAENIGNGCVKIGRVLTRTHGLGHGRALISLATAAIRERVGAKTLTVHAQCDARRFYQNMGFIPTSDEYVEEGVMHISMELKL